MWKQLHEIFIFVEEKEIINHFILKNTLAGMLCRWENLLWVSNVVFWLLGLWQANFIHFKRLYLIVK